jgi:hypothetical protein
MNALPVDPDCLLQPTRVRIKEDYVHDLEVKVVSALYVHVIDQH